MGRKKSWFLSVKKVLSSDSEGNKSERASKSKKKWFGKEKQSVSDSQNHETVEVTNPYPLPPLEESKQTEVDLEPKDTYIDAVDTADQYEDAAAPEDSVGEVQPCHAVQSSGMPEDEAAAIKIQTAFRGYLARRALRALKGLVRLKSLVDGPTVKRQTANTMKCMQALSRVQSQIQSRRIRMLEENRALQRQLLQKHAKELETLRMGEEWDDSLQSKEEIEESLLHKYEATMRRERALAYSYTHQQMWKKSAKASNLLYMDPTNPHWGWSWLERWMAARPWETQSTSRKDLNSENLPTKSASLGNTGGEIIKSFARHHLNSKSPSSPASPANKKMPSPATPPSKTAASLVVVRKPSSAIPRGSAVNQEDDLKSTLSVQSDRNRRHSIAGSSVIDDESFASSMSVPSYMASTHSTKAKSRLPSLLGMENGNTSEKASPGSAKKRLLYPPSPAKMRRHSGPPKVDATSIADSDVNGVVS